MHYLIVIINIVCLGIVTNILTFLFLIFIVAWLCNLVILFILFFLFNKELILIHLVDGFK